MSNIKRYFLFTLLVSCFFMKHEVHAQKINQYDKNNKRTGLWKKNYPNKKERYIGNFKNGKEIGVFKYYDITTSKFPVIIKEFSNISNSASVKYFTLRGKLQSKGTMVGKQRVGKWLYYFTDGTILSEEYYKNGLLEGDFKIYYKNGKLTEHTMYKNGLKHGFSKKYSDEGVLIEEVMYVRGKENGLAKYFELNGNLKETGVYENGKRSGEWEFYLDGEIASDKDKEKSRGKFKKEN